MKEYLIANTYGHKLSYNLCVDWDFLNKNILESEKKW